MAVLCKYSTMSIVVYLAVNCCPDSVTATSSHVSGPAGFHPEALHLVRVPITWNSLLAPSELPPHTPRHCEDGAGRLLT